MAGTSKAIDGGLGSPGPPRREDLTHRLHQQSALAHFGRQALEAATLDVLLDAAVRHCCDGVHARFCTAAEFLPDRNALLIRAGVGWRPGVVGRAILDMDSPAGLAFRTGAPVIADHPADSASFRTPPLLTEHGVERTLVVPVALGGGRRWGTLVADSSDASGRWDEADVEFMMGTARLLGVAVDRQAATGERRRAEAALEESRAALTTIVNSVDQMIWSACPDGYHDYFNRRWYEFTGVPPGSVDGDGWTGLLHPDDRARTLARWRRSLETGEPYEAEIRLRRRDGEHRWVLARARPVRNEAGEVVRWMGTSTDIHEQKAFGEHFRMLHEAQPTAHLVLALDFTIEEASEPYLRATMTRREDVVGKNMFDVFPANPEDPTATGARNLRASIERVLASRAPDRMPVQKHDVRRPSGEYEVRWWAPLNAPVFGPDGEVRRIIHQVEDVTAEMQERERAADARAGEARFRAVADNIPGLVFETDLDARDNYVSAQYRTYTGLPYEALLGHGWRQVLHPDDADRVIAGWAETVRTGRPSEFECPIRRADGAWRWFLVRISPLRAADGQVERGIGVCTDITEQRRAVELQRTLLHEVGHRVKNSLALVSGLLKLQARSAESGARHALEEASLRVHAVARVHDLLWRQAGTREIDLEPFLCDVSATVATAAPRHHTLCRADPAVVSADLAVPLGLLVNELLTNAYKHAYPEGAEGEVRLSGTRAGPDRYRLEVADSGVGLPPGFDLAAARESLGMRVVTSLAAQLGGELTAGLAEPGARFSLVFSLEREGA